MKYLQLCTELYDWQYEDGLKERVIPITVRCLQIYQCDTPHQQKKRLKPYDHLSGCRKTYPFMIKTLMKIGIEGTYLNIIKTIYVKLTTNIIVNGEKFKALPLKLGFPLSLLLFNIVLDVLSTEKKIMDLETCGCQRGRRGVGWMDAWG